MVKEWKAKVMNASTQDKTTTYGGGEGMVVFKTGNADQ